ncbi:MAG: PTPA-CTERM sorting domain-containing protein [Synechococcales bacterium]|nr:PTPA-CTERM sorting domain-containing protein [Synechococcales bacterium]
MLVTISFSAIATAGTILGVSPLSAQAATFTEQPDEAGELLGNALLVQDNLLIPFVPTDINGKLQEPRGSQPDDRADLFKIIFPQSGFLTAFTGNSSGGAGSLNDAQLFLFNALGQGVLANDDDGTGLAARIEGFITAGTYYLGISGYDYDPRDAGGNLIFPSFPFTPIYGPNPGVGPLASWGGGSGYGTYKIDLDFQPAAIPTPALLPGLVGFGATVLRKRRKLAAMG